MDVIPIFNKDIYDNVVDDLMLSVKESLWIITANLKNIFVRHPSNPGKVETVFELFNFLIKKNISIRILHSARPSASFNNYIEEYNYLFDKGLDIRKCQRVHLKAVIADDSKAYVGSANFTGAGIGLKGKHKRNFEIGFITEDKDYIRELECMISGIWYGEECSLCQLKESCSPPISELKY